MIPEIYINQWRNVVPWQTNEQVEQDLVICRALIEIFNHPYLKENVAFRGGTALHKLYLQPQPRYSEDIDLVVTKSLPYGNLIDAIREAVSFLENPNVTQDGRMVTLKFRFSSELENTPMRLKIETNTREHFSVLGLKEMDYSVKSDWFTGECKLITYELEELLGTKLRALYQRKKGRDLFDLYKALIHADIDVDKLIACYRKYMGFSSGVPPTQTEFLNNMEAKMQSQLFLGDIKSIINPTENYNNADAFELVKERILLKL